MAAAFNALPQERAKATLSGFQKEEQKPFVSIQSHSREIVQCRRHISDREAKWL